MKIISYDVVQNGSIIDTIQMPESVDVAVLTQTIRARLNVDVKSIHLCKLRWQSKQTN